MDIKRYLERIGISELRFEDYPASEVFGQTTLPGNAEFLREFGLNEGYRFDFH